MPSSTGNKEILCRQKFGQFLLFVYEMSSGFVKPVETERFTDPSYAEPLCNQKPSN